MNIAATHGHFGSFLADRDPAPYIVAYLAFLCHTRNVYSHVCVCAPCVCIRIIRSHNICEQYICIYIYIYICIYVCVYVCVCVYVYVCVCVCLCDGTVRMYLTNMPQNTYLDATKRARTHTFAP
jgi:hypothetical protein